MKSHIKYTIASLLFLCSIQLLTGCNTVQGVGKDVQTLGGGAPNTSTTTTETTQYDSY